MSISAQEPIVINGKEYPLWSQFVHRKEEWIGGILQDFDHGNHETKIVDITLEPNGESSAFFWVHGEDFNCGFDVHYGGVGPGEPDWTTFYGYDHTWRIKEATKQ